MPVFRRDKRPSRRKRHHMWKKSRQSARERGDRQDALPEPGRGLGWSLHVKRVPVDEPTHTQRILTYGCWHCDTIREKQKGSLEGSPETLRPVRCSLRTTRSVRIHTFDRGSYSSKCVLRFYATLLRRSLRFGIRLSQETESCSCKVCDTEKHICIVGNCLCGFRLILLACRLG